MNEWLQKNAWAILIAASAVVSSYAIYGYQISDIERRLTADEKSIAVINQQNVQTQIALAQIQVDLTYIKQAIDKLEK